jgi:enolase-phosphatase E1
MNAAATKVYLLDVEGTVAPISLVSEQLFPYARKHVSAFLAQHGAQPEVQADLRLLAEENARETDSQCPRLTAPKPSAERALAYLLWLMDRDRKSTALKSLQGKIWKIGFESGELKGTLFADVPPAFARWMEHARVAIYSSGSVEAQKQLFRYSTFGDLTPQIAAYFDTRVGAKVEHASYAAIATALEVQSGEILFCSDVVRELDAARAAGCRTRLVVRPGNAAVADANGHAIVESFVLL